MDEFETIKLQMEAKRSSLADKLEALEQQVSDSVQGVTDAMSNVTGVVQDTVESVKGSVENVKDSLQDTVGAVKETFDLPLQMERHPLIMLGGAMAVGFMAGRLLPDMTTAAATTGAAASALPREHTFRERSPWESEEPEQQHYANSRRPTTNGHHKASWFDGLKNLVTPEMEKLKNLALATALGLVRDYMKQGVPSELGTELAGMIDNITTRLGAQPLHENLVGPKSAERPAMRN